jgi:hypothetical protein
MGLVKIKPWTIAEHLSKKLNINVIAAHDGMVVNLDEYEK